MNTAIPITPSSVFLVSGGARGITAQCVIQLAQEFQAKFILLGRTSISEPEPIWARGYEDEQSLKKQMVAHCQAQGQKVSPREIQSTCSHIQALREINQTLAAIKQAGGDAKYVATDITDNRALKQNIASAVDEIGAITGLIHGAGNLADKRIEDKTERDFDIVYKTKITGLQNLLSCFDLDQLKHLVLFSSAAGFYGNTGQTDYALANDILNKIAYTIKHRYPLCNVFAFNWGPWDGGMVTPVLRQYFIDNGIPIIPIQTGTQILTNSLQTGGPIQTVVGGALAMPQTEPDHLPETHRIHRKLTEAANPFLQDHVIGGVAVLPTVCAISWIGRTCEQCYPGFKFAQCHNFKVLKGIVFDQTLSEEYSVDLQKIDHPQTDEIAIDVKISSEPQTGKTRYHYSAQVILRSQLPDPPHYAFSPTKHNDIDIACYQNGTLFHGPCFQGIQNILELSDQKLTMVCKAPLISDLHQGQFPIHTFNPYAADVQFQSMVVWARHMYDAGSLPLSCKFGEQFKTVSPNQTFYVSMEVESATESHLTASIVTHDDQGYIYNRISGAEVTISKQLNPLFLQNNAIAQSA